MENLDSVLAVIDTFGTIGVLGLMLWYQSKTIDYERLAHNETQKEKDTMAQSFIDFLKTLVK